MYTNLARVALEIKGTAANQGALIEQQVLQYIRTVTRRIDTFKFKFEPWYYTRRLTPNPSNINGAMGLLSLGDFLLEPTSIGVGTSTPVYGTDVLSYPNDGEYPIQTLRLANMCSGCASWWYPCGGCNPFESIAIAGFWGMNTDYANYGWLDSLQTCPALTATQTTITVTNADAADSLGRTPVLSPGNLIRVENEMMDVLLVDTATNILTVKRGVRGSTAASHSVGLPIRVYEVPDDVANAATRQAALLYSRRGSYMQVTTMPDGVSIQYPSDLLAELRAMIQSYSYV